jgi:hypothetical protein
MPFFPPSLSPNNKVHVSDERNVAERGIARFANYIQDAVVYWPWLSWNEIDVAVGPDQRAIPRCTLVGDSGHNMFSVAADQIGAIVRFGSVAQDQLWEVIHNFDWFDYGEIVKKFTVLWCRLWVPPIAAAPVPIVGGPNWAGAVELELNTLYVTTLAATETYVKATPVSGPFTWSQTKKNAAPPDVGSLFYHGLPATQVQFAVHTNSGAWTMTPPSPGLGVKFAPAPQPDFQLEFKLWYPA